MKASVVSTVFIAILVLAGCKKDNKPAIDTEYPVINLDFAEAFPKQCSELTRGQKITFRARFSDNAQLGSYSLDIHHNFDHHTHSTEVASCNLDPVKAPANPFLLIENYPIPAGGKTYEAQTAITVPDDVDPGDYHLMIRLTDREGWQTLKGLSIKIR